jgi:serine/threonine-protein kinase HipA
MNGERVGGWSSLRSGRGVFRYVREWVESPRARALSLSLPLTADGEVRGAVVDHFFDNLLPDSIDIRRRVRDRFGLRSVAPFELLEAIGRDCVGAVQLLPPGEPPERWNRVDADALTTRDVERILAAVVAPSALGRGVPDDEAFRISIAGAQEKTALLSMGGAWFRPRRATPSTHILKLPLGLIGNFRGDFTHSVENEWLCSQLLRELGLPVAETRMARFGEQRALVVKRFDRRWVGVDDAAPGRRRFTPPPGAWIARLPQEDFCQATGRPPSERYEADGGASADEILELLARSETADGDRARFVLSQFAFWLLAATDGHAKNFSIQHRAGGRFGLAPLYDILSAWPVVGRGANLLPIQDVRLAMSVAGRARHYRLLEILPRHWHAHAQRIGGAPLRGRLQAFAEAVDAAVARVESSLPRGFPDLVISRIGDGTRSQARAFLAARD